MTKLEQVARGLARRILNEETGVLCITGEAKAALERSVDRLWPECVKDARAAIEAMREPTEAMVKAGERVVDDHFDHWDPGRFHGIGEAWNAMVDAALVE